MEINLILDQVGKEQPLNFTCNRMVNAGYVGRDQAEVRRHIDELAQKGIPGPEVIPTLYPIIRRTLTTDSVIEVFGHETCGEVEYVLLVVDDNDIYVGIGSDHTDRDLEKTDIPRAKLICPNIMSKSVWPLSEIIDHWDDLLIRSKTVKDGKEILYQEGRLELILNPADLMEFVRSKISDSLEGTIIFSGTVGIAPGEFVFGEQFSAELIDERLNRRLEISYAIEPLGYMEIS